METMIAETGNDRRIAGGILLASAVLFIALIGHHPTFASGPALIRLMHGAILAAMLVQMIGFLFFARWMGGGWTQAGMLAFVLAVVAGGGAGLINGFVVPAMMEGQAAIANRAPFDLLWAANQVLATAGIWLTCVAFAIWSSVLIRRKWPVIGALGLVAAALPVAALASGMANMHLSGAMALYSVQAGWAVVLGGALLRRG
jgi:hypothetical protein